MKHCSCPNNQQNPKLIVCDKCNLPLKEVVAEVTRPELGSGVGRDKYGVVVQFPISDEDID
jgi:hypothetical protein